MFGDLNDCYGHALQQELAEANRLEQELIEAGNREADRYYAEELGLKMDEILASLDEDIELLGDSVEERKTKADIAKLLELLQYDSDLNNQEE